MFIVCVKKIGEYIIIEVKHTETVSKRVDDNHWTYPQDEKILKNALTKIYWRETIT